MKKLILAAVLAAAPMIAVAEGEPVDYKAELATLVGVETLSDEQYAELVKKGEKAFRKCKACHKIDEEVNRVGPHQIGVVGRPAGAVEGFKYSKAMAESGLVWDVPTLDGYLTSPKKFLKGNKMSFAGLRKPADRQAVIAYLLDKGGAYVAPTN